MKLTERQCRGVRPTEKMQKLSDGKGLVLVVHPNGSKYWHGRYKLAGKEQTKTLGAYPELTLAQAREAWHEFKDSGYSGIKRLAGQEPTVMEMVDARNAVRPFGDSRFKTFERYAPKWFTAMKMVDVRRSHIVAVIEHVVKTAPKSVPEKMKLVIKCASDYAVDSGVVEVSYAQRLGSLIPSYEPTHYPSMHENKIATYIGAINAKLPKMKFVLRAQLNLLDFLIPLRANELRQLSWSELNDDLTEGTIASSRMKMRKSFRFPISAQAREILKDIPRVHDKVFWRPSVNDVVCTLRSEELGVTGVHTMHGNRALLVKVAQEKLGFPFEVADRQLAHSVGDNTRKAYDRGVFWDQRVALMQAWGDYVEDQCRGLDGGLFAYKAFLKDPK